MINKTRFFLLFCSLLVVLNFDLYGQTQLELSAYELLKIYLENYTYELEGVEYSEGNQASIYSYFPSKTTKIYNEIRDANTTLEQYIGDCKTHSSRDFEINEVYFSSFESKWNFKKYPCDTYLKRSIRHEGAVYEDVIKLRTRLIQNEATKELVFKIDKLELFTGEIPKRKLLRYATDIKGKLKERLQNKFKNTDIDRLEKTAQSVVKSYKESYNMLTVEEDPYAVELLKQLQIAHFYKSTADVEYDLAGKDNGKMKPAVLYISKVSSQKPEVAYVREPRVVWEKDKDSWVSKSTYKLNVIQEKSINGKSIDRVFTIQFAGKDIRKFSKPEILKIKSKQKTLPLGKKQRKVATDSIKKLLVTYFQTIQDLPGSSNKVPSVINRFFYSQNAPIEQYPSGDAKEKISCEEYLSEIANLEQFSINPQEFRIGEISPSERNPNVFYAVAIVPFAADVSDGRNFKVVEGRFNISVQFRRSTDGSIGQYRIGRKIFYPSKPSSGARAKELLAKVIIKELPPWFKAEYKIKYDLTNVLANENVVEDPHWVVGWLDKGKLRASVDRKANGQMNILLKKLGVNVELNTKDGKVNWDEANTPFNILERPFKEILNENLPLDIAQYQEEFGFPDLLNNVQRLFFGEAFIPDQPLDFKEIGPVFHLISEGEQSKIKYIISRKSLSLLRIEFLDRLNDLRLNFDFSQKETVFFGQSFSSSIKVAFSSPEIGHGWLDFQLKDMDFPWYEPKEAIRP